MMSLLRMGMGTTLVVLLLVGCASSGPLFSEAEAKLPPPGPNQGRVIIYSMRMKLNPDIVLNGKVVGEVGDGEVIVVDTHLGEHKIAISTEVERVLTFRIDRGEHKYVRVDFTTGVFVGRVYPELVDVRTARKDLAGNPPYYEFHFQRHVIQ